MQIHTQIPKFDAKHERQVKCITCNLVIIESSLILHCVGVNYDITQFGIGSSNGILWRIFVDVIDFICPTDSFKITEALHCNVLPMLEGQGGTFAQAFRDSGLNMGCFDRQVSTILVRFAYLNM